ncbi:hypothetical protein [Turicibacter sp.]|uniref:hypothetical protein n=1 Tax=Turicibacter sp. TaxID=2049042 RepID=UPI001B78C55B|nr:hypothetical protein [Turicibacter sp.]MBP3902864.1 hypothetical protein [Turicibacter sp.]
MNCGSLELLLDGIGLSYKYFYKDYHQKTEISKVCISGLVDIEASEIELILNDIDFLRETIYNKFERFLSFKERIEQIEKLWERDRVVVFDSLKLSYSQCLKDDFNLKKVYLKSSSKTVFCTPLTGRFVIGYADFMFFDQLLVPLNDVLSSEELEEAKKIVNSKATCWNHEKKLIDFSTLSEREVALVLNNIIGDSFFHDYSDGCSFERTLDVSNTRSNIYHFKSKKNKKTFYSIYFSFEERLRPIFIKYQTSYGSFNHTLRNKIALTSEVIEIISEFRFSQNIYGDWWE